MWVAAVSGRGLLNPPVVATSRPATIATTGAINLSGIEPTTCQASAAGSYCRMSPTTFRGGVELLHRPPTTRIRPLWTIVLPSKWLRPSGKLAIAVHFFVAGSKRWQGPGRSA